MPIQGTELIARIQSLVNLQTRSEGRRLGSAMAERVLPDLEKHGAARHADIIFDMLRRTRRDFRNIQSVFKRDSDPARDHMEVRSGIESVLYETLSVLGDFTKEDVKEFYSKHEDFFEELLRELNQSRSKATHILAVFRPFKEKYVASWAKELDHYPAEEIRARAQALEGVAIMNPFDLDIWVNQVYELFEDSSVFKGKLAEEVKYNEGAGRLRARHVPFGMISESSERIYRQRWLNWYNENEKELSALVLGERGMTQNNWGDVLKLGGFNSTHMPSSFHMSTPLVQNPTNADSAPIAAAASPATQGQITLSVQSVSSAKLKGQRTWLNEDLALGELELWLGMLDGLWQEHAREVSIEVKFVTATGDSEVTLPAMNVASAMKTLPQVIKSYR
jgi:hypothetical protein